MKYIIGLCGAANTGKSTTLKLLVDYLGQSQGFNNLGLGNFVLGSKDKNTGDFRATFQHQKTNSIICITTGGDAPSVTRENIVYAKINKANILITATRSGGGTVTELYPATNDSVPFFIGKTYQSSVKHLSIDEINELDFKNILLVLNGLLVS